MPKKVLVGFATRYGSTEETAKLIGDSLRDGGFEVDVMQVRDVKNLIDYQAIILGAPLFMFHWHKDVLKFLSKHQNLLLDRFIGIFA